MQSYKADKENSFDDLFHKYKNLVYKTAYLMLGNTEEAEDVLQEVFIKLYGSLHSFKSSKGAFTTWLYRITINHCLNCKRKNNPHTIPLNESPTSDSLAIYPSPEDYLVEKLTIQKAIDQLSEKLRTVVILRYYRELSYSEIAEILKVPLGTIKSRLNLSLKTLGKQIKSIAKDDTVPGIVKYKENLK